MSRAHLSGGGNLYDSDPTYFPRGKTKRPLPKAEKKYLRTLTPEKLKRHLEVRNHPSGRPSYGGANRSSNIKREINLTVTRFTPCSVCGGVTFTTTLLPHCNCEVAAIE